VVLVETGTEWSGGGVAGRVIYREMSSVEWGWCETGSGGVGSADGGQRGFPFLPCGPWIKIQYGELGAV
jgi:hypothetical protein